jgi:hypothetical protein
MPDRSEVSRQDRARQSYLRWQKITLIQLGSVVKLVLTLTGAAIAFGADLLVKNGAKGGCFVRWMQWSMAVLLLAAFFGLAVNATRLWDFRWTRRATRIRSRDKKAEADELKRCRARHKFWGRLTWRFFCCQFAFFFLGILLLAAAVMLYPPSEKSENSHTAVTISTAPPPVTPVTPHVPATYTVLPGDSLSKIAKKTSNAWNQIYLANRSVIGVDPNRLTPGQRLTLPEPQR